MTERFDCRGNYVVVSMAFWLAIVLYSGLARATALDEALEAFRSRELAIEGAEVEWQSSVFYPRGSQPSLKSTSEPTPKDDTSLQRKHSLKLLNANCVRYERTGAVWNFVTGKIEDTRFEEVHSEGKVFTLSHRFPEKEGTHPAGTIGPQTDAADRSSISSIAVVSLLRPGCETLGILSPSHTQSAEVEVQDGATMVSLKCSRNSEGISYVYKLDPSDGFLPRSITLYNNGRAFKEIGLRYESAREVLGGFSGWTSTKTDLKGRLIEESSCSISVLRINPEGLGSEDFAYVFPESTEVGDYTNDPPTVFVARGYDAEGDSRP